MKTITLKVEGDEKVKFKLFFEFDEVKIILFQGGTSTKYHDTLTIQGYGNETVNLDYIADTIQNLYREYLKGKTMEEELVKLFEDKKTIELNVL